MSSKYNTVRTILKCPNCGELTTIHRLASRQKKVGHLKKLYCYRCKKEVNHIELKDEFILDREYNRTRK